MRYRIFCTLLLVWFASSCRRTKPVEAWWVDSLVKVFPDDSVGSHALGQPAFAAARRANLSLQLALRSPLGIGDLYVDALPLSGPGMPIDRIQVRRVEYVVATTNTPGASRNAVLRQAPAWFPDALVTGFPMTVEKNRTRAVWITVSVAADQSIGHYAGVLRLRQGLEELIRIPYTLDVTEAAVPAEIPFEVSHRFILNEAYSQQFYRTARFSSQWWVMAGNLSRFLAGYHQTSIPADPMELVVAGASGAEMRYDFSNYVRFVRLFESAGVRGSLDGGQLLGRGAARGRSADHAHLGGGRRPRGPSGASSSTTRACRRSWRASTDRYGRRWPNRAGKTATRKDCWMRPARGKSKTALAWRPRSGA